MIPVGIESSGSIMNGIKQMVLAHSGGLDTSVVLRRLADTYRCEVMGRTSPVSLYHTDFVTFGADQVYHQADTTGFIRSSALRLRIRALARKRGPAEAVVKE